MKIRFTHKKTNQVVTIDNTNATSNADIKIESVDPNLLIIFTQELRIDHDINTLPENQKKFINPDTQVLEMFSDEYFNEILIPSKEQFFDIEIL